MPSSVRPARLCLPRYAMALLFMVTSASSQADTVTLANGDRLTGTVLLLDGGTLVLKTSYAGELRIAWSQVVQLSTEEPVLVRAPGVPIGYHARLDSTGEAGAAILVAEANGHAQGDSGSAQAGTAMQTPATATVESPVVLGKVERIVRPHPVLRDWTFQGTVDLALDANHAANSNENWSVSLNSTMRRYNWRHGLQLDYTRKSQDKIVGTHNYTTLYTLDRFVSEKFFLQGRLKLARDYVDDPAHKLMFATGPGYQFWDNEMGALSVSGLLTHTRYRYQDEQRTHFQSLGIGWDYHRYFSGKQWQVFSQGEVYQALSQGADHSLNASAGLRYSLTNWLSLYTKASYSKVSALEDSGTSERKYSVGLTAKW